MDSAATPPPHNPPSLFALPPPPPPPRPWWPAVVTVLLLISLSVNGLLWCLSLDWLGGTGQIEESFHAGTEASKNKVVLIEIAGTIMPPFTDRILKQIKQAKEDEGVKGVLLRIDSPGGFVADSHQIYHRLKELSAKKPLVVQMGSFAASGGYYVALGGGPESKIYAEPTTWTGSIGVIIPRYELTGLKEKIGIDSKPLKTGEFKDALSPFHSLTERETAVWNNILGQSFERFLRVIDENRSALKLDDVRKLATGQIYTADDALREHLIDAIGFEEDAIEDLRKRLGAADVRVMRYSSSTGLIDLVLGASARETPAEFWNSLLETTVPRAMYYCSSLPPVTTGKP